MAFKCMALIGFKACAIPSAAEALLIRAKCA